MIVQVANVSSSRREVHAVWIATDENEASHKALILRRALPRKTGWKVRTNKRVIGSDGITIPVFVVTAWRPA